MLQAERLREAREKLGMNRRELSRACGLGDNMIYRYEKGIADPTSKTLATIAAKLGVSSDYLLGLSNEPRGQLGDSNLNIEEDKLLSAYRHDGWPGVFKLGAELIGK